MSLHYPGCICWLTVAKVQTVLGMVNERFALESIPNLLMSANVTNILAMSPQTILAPISYNFVNLVPFDKPVYVLGQLSFFLPYLIFILTVRVFFCFNRATATTFVGLIFLTILSFFVVVSHFLHSLPSQWVRELRVPFLSSDD